MSFEEAQYIIIGMQDGWLEGTQEEYENACMWIIKHVDELCKKEIKKMYKIEIKKNPNGDTRTANKNVTFEEFQEANNMHRLDVKRVMMELSDKLFCAGINHDVTKKTQERLFYNNFLSTLNNGTDFVNDEWYKMHIVAERHHLLSNCPDDVNLLDVLEMIADCVCAGMARSGEIRGLELSDEILEKAVWNTVELIKSMITVTE